ncbi:uncharacterized protein LOC133792419 [Humulus lupulus]|uniref:uncharacterized protein LOC133792419 n=1 Tax=Humulus lupulus TaxID=3486 RepID=UPI002B404699|nr:uncharacterized protein LOC133792419 [Humulus lupulus]
MGGARYPSWLILGFQQMVHECGLMNLELRGQQFSWEKGRGTDQWIKVRIDRALVSHNWIDMFSLARLTNLDFSSSDHSPIFLEPIYRSQQRKKYSFRFENAWLSEPLCYQLVQDNWEKRGQLDFGGKLQLCIAPLSHWGREVTGRFKDRLKACKVVLQKFKNRTDKEGLSHYTEAYQQLFQTLHQ